jgi:lysophospholipase L1-like esterase
MLKYLLITVALPLSGCETTNSLPQQSSSAPQSAVASVAVIGDSIMAHWGNLTELIPGAINAGVGGGTTKQMLDRFDRDLLAHHPSIVVIEGGINDIVHLEDPTPRYVAQMAQRASTQGACIILIAITPTNLESWVTELSQRWNDELLATAQAYGYVYVDFGPSLRRHDESSDVDYLADAVHLTPEGYEAAWPILRAALARVRNEPQVSATGPARF